MKTTFDWGCLTFQIIFLTIRLEPEEMGKYQNKRQNQWSKHQTKQNTTQGLQRAFNNPLRYYFWEGSFKFDENVDSNLSVRTISHSHYQKNSPFWNIEQKWKKHTQKNTSNNLTMKLTQELTHCLIFFCHCQSRNQIRWWRWFPLK